MATPTIPNDLKEAVKDRLFRSIGAQIDAICHVAQERDAIHRQLDREQANEPRSQAGEAASPARAGDADAPPDAAPGRATLVSSLNRYYDHSIAGADWMTNLLLGDTDYRNIGYWDETTPTQNAASERLQDVLLEFIPDKRGRILDVACGAGASTRRLLDHYPAEQVWAINISDAQIEATRQRAPGCHALVMDAVDLKFEDVFFDNLICIEAALHFETRRRFLEEAHRVLKPGGHLVMSDMLFSSKARMQQYPVFPSPENHLESADAYRDLLLDAGFTQARVRDASREIWQAHFLHHVGRVHRAFYEGVLSLHRLTDVLWKYYHMNEINGRFVLVNAVK